MTTELSRDEIARLHAEAQENEARAAANRAAIEASRMAEAQRRDEREKEWASAFLEAYDELDRQLVEREAELERELPAVVRGLMRGDASFGDLVEAWTERSTIRPRRRTLGSPAQNAGVRMGARARAGRLPALAVSPPQPLTELLDSAAMHGADELAGELFEQI